MRGNRCEGGGEGAENNNILHLNSLPRVLFSSFLYAARSHLSMTLPLSLQKRLSHLIKRKKEKIIRANNSTHRTLHAAHVLTKRHDLLSPARWFTDNLLYNLRADENIYVVPKVNKHVTRLVTTLRGLAPLASHHGDDFYCAPVSLARDLALSFSTDSTLSVFVSYTNKQTHILLHTHIHTSISMYLPIYLPTYLSIYISM